MLLTVTTLTKSDKPSYLPDVVKMSGGLGWVGNMTSKVFVDESGTDKKMMLIDPMKTWKK